MKRTILVLIAVLALVATGCVSGSARRAEQQTAEDQLTRFLQTQPVPTFTWSQLRQNLIELETSQAHTTQTTTFFFNLGIKDPIANCPSIGFPIAATYQLSSPQSATRVGGSSGRYILPQLEATGVYTANTTGTYVMCTNDAGQAYAQYWEGYVMAVTGPATWQDGQVVLTGAPTFDFSVGEQQ